MLLVTLEWNLALDSMMIRCITLSWELVPQTLGIGGKEGITLLLLNMRVFVVATLLRYIHTYTHGACTLTNSCMHVHTHTHTHTPATKGYTISARNCTPLKSLTSMRAAVGSFFKYRSFTTPLSTNDWRICWNP